MTTQQQTARIVNGLSTALKWEEDPELLKECRSLIPFSLLIDSDDVILIKGRYSRPDDGKYEGDDLLLKRLTLWFKLDFMTWVNSPPCSFCGCKENMASLGTRGPITQEEKDGGAGRVEVYNCPLCNSETTFPRYNSPRKLLQARQGRCGEFANVFGLVCRSVGFEVRYILDYTDHVWVEVWSNRQDRWIMADSCEGKIDAPLMYEHGWGKQLSHIFAYYAGDDDGTPHVVDVTKRYTRKFDSEEMQSRRAAFCSSEVTLQLLLKQINARWRASAKTTKAGAARISEMERRKKIEAHFLQTSQTRGTEIEANPEECEGRLSGSLAWKASRDELGTLHTQNSAASSKDNDGIHNATAVPSFHRESFLPVTRLQYLRVRAICVSTTDNVRLPLHQMIVVSDVECAVGDKGLNIVVVDEQTGCILQSRLFTSWENADHFVNTVPDGRVIIMSMIGAIQGKSSSVNNNNNMLSLAPTICSRLGGFPSSVDEDASIAFVGQVGFKPRWAAVAVSSSSVLPGSVGVHVTLKHTFNGHLTNSVTLVEDHDVMPRRVFSRLSENIMPLNTQLLASEEQKKQAAILAMKVNPACVGFVTKPHYPIYLFSASAFPMQPVPKETTTTTASNWRTYYYLPTSIAPAIESKLNISVEVPVNTAFFHDLFGQSLLRHAGSKSSSINVTTQDALGTKRLVALYFSAHWCPPCRQFTPMFAEFYSTLKESQPDALEVVFISSDKDPSSFQGYISSMPWLALPFEERFRKESISSRYSVRGIPAVVVIDTISGMVTCQEQARNDIMRGCRSGDKGVTDIYNHWLSLIPEESKIILESIKLSLEEAAPEKDSDGPNPYLVRKIPEVKTINPSDLIKSYFIALVAQGKNPTTAAAEAIERVAAEQRGQQLLATLESGPFDSMIWEIHTSLDAVVFPDLKWSDDCSYFCDDRQIHSSLSELQAIRWVASISTGNVTAVQSVYADGVKGPCHSARLGEQEGGCVNHKLDNNDETPITIEGEINQTGIVLQSPNSKKEHDGYSAKPFSLCGLPGCAISGLHVAIAPTGIVALGINCKKSNCSPGDFITDEVAKPQRKLHVLENAVKALTQHGHDKELIRSITTTAKKYIENARKQPFNPKFRTFKLHNKVSDRMAQFSGGINLLVAMHFSLFCSSSEYLVSLSPDLDRMEKAVCIVEELLSESVTSEC